MTEETKTGDEPVTMKGITSLIASTVEACFKDRDKSNEPDPVEMAVQAETERVSSIHTVCMQAKFTQEEVNKFVDEKTPLVEVQSAVIVRMQATNKPASDGPEDETEDDPSMLFRTQYRDSVKLGVQMTSSEDEYVKSCCKTAGIEMKGAKA